MPIYYPDGYERYKPGRFLAFVVKRLWTDGCPLCGEKHAPRFHCFAPRTYRKDPTELSEKALTKVVTQVPRVLCETNHQIRKQTGEPKQYTLTILPGFLIPQSRISVDRVHQALHSYITGSGLKQVGAALRMNCLSPASFRLFYSRVCRRVGAWTAVLAQWIVAFGGRVAEADAATPRGEGVAAQWGWFLRLSAEYARLYGRVPGVQVVPHRDLRQYLYAVLSRHHRGLGP